MRTKISSCGYNFTDLLKHDKVLSKKPPPAHLRAVPEYLMDRTTQEASKILKLARAAMGKTGPTRRPGPNRGFGKTRDPLKTFSAEVRSHLSPPLHFQRQFPLLHILAVCRVLLFCSALLHLLHTPKHFKMGHTRFS